MSPPTDPTLTQGTPRPALPDTDSLDPEPNTHSDKVLRKDLKPLDSDRLAPRTADDPFQVSRHKRESSASETQPPTSKPSSGPTDIRPNHSYWNALPSYRWQGGFCSGLLTLKRPYSQIRGKNEKKYVFRLIAGFLGEIRVGNVRFEIGEKCTSVFWRFLGAGGTPGRSGHALGGTGWAWGRPGRPGHRPELISPSSWAKKRDPQFIHHPKARPPVHGRAKIVDTRNLRADFPSEF